MEMINYLFCFETKYPNYFVNKQGDVFSTKRGGIKKLKPVTTKWGYLQVSICNNNKIKQMSVHRLVAETFIPNPENKCDVNHKNGLKTDNRVENLEWMTHQENIDHAILNGLHNTIGENHGRAKLTEHQVIEIKKLYSQRKYNKTNQYKLAKMFGITQPQISSIINNKVWKHI